MTQLGLNWSRPEIPLNSTAPAEPRLQRACRRLLARLVEGPARAHELEQIGGRRFGARLAEIRRFLLYQSSALRFAIADPIPYPGSGANPVYRLEAWARPTALGLLARRMGAD